MTYAAQKILAGREPIEVIEIDYPRCLQVYGTAPCTAAIGTTGSRKCYNTRKTCQDPANFIASASTLRFSNLPIPTPGNLLVPALDLGDLFNEGVARWPTLGSDFTVSHETADPITGPGSLRINASGASPTGYISEVYNVPEAYRSSTVRLSVTTRDESGGTLVAGDYQVLVQAGAGAYLITEDLDPTGTQTFDFTLTGETSITVYFTLTSVATGEDLVIDDLSILELDDASQPIVGYTAADLRSDYFAYPTLIEVSDSPTIVSTEGELGKRSVLTVTLLDMPDNDSGVDPYLSDRDFDPLTRGTQWSKLLARMPYLEGQALRRLRGYLTDPIDWSNFETEYYIIESVELLDDGSVRVIAKDPLKLIDDERHQVPTPSTGTLAAAINTAVQDTITISTGDGYAEGDLVRINGEIILLGTEASAVFTGCSRGQEGTTATTHSEGDSVQVCKVYSAVRADVVLRDLLVDEGGINGDYADAAAWAATGDQWFPGLNLSAVISEPTGIKTLVSEILELGLLLWWDRQAQEIGLDAAHRPPRVAAAVQSFVENDITEGDIAISEETDRRLSRVLIFFGQIDVTKPLDEHENYRNLQFSINADSEDANTFGAVPRTKKIYTRWLQSGGSGIALQLAGRLLTTNAEAAKVVTFDVDTSDAAVDVGDLAAITTGRLVDDTGASLKTPLRIVSRQEIDAGTTVRYQAERTGFVGRYAFFGPDTLDTYANESETNRERYGFFSDASELMSDGSEPYKFV